MLSRNAFSSALRTWATTTRTSRHLSSTARRFKDPWLLPNTPEHELSTQSPPNLPPPTPIPRPNEPVETLRARLVYQSRKRGTLESDLILSTFAQEYLGKMSEDELKEYDKVRYEWMKSYCSLLTSGQLLDEPDWDIYYWSTEKREPPERWATSQLLEKLRVHARNEGKVIRRMPALSEHGSQTTSS